MNHCAESVQDPKPSNDATPRRFHTMTRWSRHVALAAMLVVTSYGSPARAETLAGLKWQVDYGKAHQIRIRDKRPMLVFVSMDGCPHCHRMLETTYRNQAVTDQITKDFVPTYINGTQHQSLARKFGVRVYPTTFVVGANNLVVDKIEGYVSADQLRQRIAAVSDRMANESSSVHTETR